MSDDINIKAKSTKTKLFIIIAAVVIALSTVGAVLFAMSKSATAKKVEKQLSLGEKYLSELDYEQAIVAYELAIEIDPKNVEAYIGLADVYIAMGEYEKAEEVLEEAKDRVDEDDFRKIEGKLEEIKEDRKDEGSVLDKELVGDTNGNDEKKAANQEKAEINQLTATVMENEYYVSLCLDMKTWPEDAFHVYFGLLSGDEGYNVDASLEYHIREDGEIDEMWLGYVRKNGVPTGFDNRAYLKREGSRLFCTFTKTKDAEGINGVGLESIRVESDGKQAYVWDGTYTTSDVIVPEAQIAYWEQYGSGGGGIYPIEYAENATFAYKVYNTNEIAVTGIKNEYQTRVVIPEIIDGMRVTGVDLSLSYGSAVSEVVLPESITWIDEGSFWWSEVSEINLPNSLVWIGEGAFYDSELTDLVLPDSLVWIGEDAFNGCFDESYRNGYKEIYITIPKSTRKIGGGAFMSNPRLMGITVDKDNEHFVMDNGVLYTKNYEILVCMLSTSEISSYSVKEGCVKILDNAFSFCRNLEHISIPDTVCEIGREAFYACDNLKEVLLPKGLKEIQYWTFGYCDNLERVILPEGLEAIRTEAFDGCDKLNEMVISKNVKEIEPEAFSGCDKISSYEVEEGNQYFSSVDGNLFSKDGTVLYQYALGKEETEYVIPDTVLEIGAGAFQYTAHKGTLTKVTIPHGVKRIGESAFCISSIKEIVIPSTVENIGNAAFFAADVERVVIEEGVKTIERQAFDDCDDLREIHIPKSVTEIQENVFNDIGNVTIIYTEPGTYAEQYAKENGISVKYE